jgi:hypothetical protein
MTNLQQLNVEDNGMSGYVPDEFFDMSSLTHLSLGYQGKNWRNCTSSTGSFIDLYTNSAGETNSGLEGLMLDKIKSMRHLKEVVIEGNYFSGEIDPGIKNLKHLGQYNYEL